MSLLDAADVALARSPCSQSITFRPRPAASRAIPAPLTPPPMTRRSTFASVFIRRPRACRCGLVNRRLTNLLAKNTKFSHDRTPLKGERRLENLRTQPLKSDKKVSRETFLSDWRKRPYINRQDSPPAPNH